MSDGMKRRNWLIGLITLGIVWIGVFIGTTSLLNQDSDPIDLEILAATQRPFLTQIAQLPNETPPVTEEVTEEATPEATEEPTEEAAVTRTPAPTRPQPTATPTQRPTARFTLSSLEITTFQQQQQDSFEEEFLANATLEIPKNADEGSYPIRLAIEDLGILASVLVVQTDPNFDIVTPREEVGYYALTSKVGGGGNTIMVGHVYPGRVFNKLLEAKVGQVVRVTDEYYEEHYYRIEEVIRFPYEVGNDEDRRLGFEYMYDNSEERLTLVTCYPEFEWTHRFVVRAIPIKKPDNDD